MPRHRRASKDVAVIQDRQGRSWTIEVMPVDHNDDLSPWLDLSPEQRIELVGECVLDGIRLEGKRDVPRLRRVHRVLERPSSTHGSYEGGDADLSSTSTKTRDDEDVLERQTC